MRRLLAIMAILLASPSVANGGDGGDSSTALKTNYKDRIIKLDGELGAVELRLRTLEANAAANANLEGRSFEIELAEARKLYQGKDCEGLMLLSGVLTLPEYQGERGYTEAQFLYGEAMLLCGNFSSALKVYERLSSGRHRFVKRCLRRIVLIQTHFEDPSKLIRWYKLADDARALDREDKYEVAKTVVYLLGAPTGAEQAKLESFTQRILAELMEDSFQNPKVFYLKAVYLVQQQKLKDAYAIFEKLAQMEGNNPSLTLLSEHSAMNAARIATEFGDHTKARLFYAQVRETSPLFERALFELAYTFVALSADIQNLDERTLAMQNAIDVLDTLALSAIDENLAANSIFIKGLIYSDLGLEEQAAAVFNSLKNRYIPLRKEAIKNVGHSDAVKKLYDAIVVEEPTSHGMLSEDIRLWLNQNSLLKETRRVSSLMELTVKLVDDTSAQVEQLNELLGHREQGDFLPTLKRPLAATLDLQNKLVVILNKINELEFSTLEPFVKKETLDKLKELRVERQKLDSRFGKLPQSAGAYETRLDNMRNGLMAYQQEVYRFRWEIEQQKRQVAALLRFLNETPEGVSPELEAEAHGLLQQEQQIVGQMELDQGALEKLIEVEAKLLAVSTSATADEEILKEKYRTLVLREEGLVAKLRAQALARMKANDSYKEMVGDLGGMAQNRIRLNEIAASLSKLRYVRLINLSASDLANYLENMVNIHRDWMKLGYDELFSNERALSYLRSLRSNLKAGDYRTEEVMTTSRLFIQKHFAAMDLEVETAKLALFGDESKAMSVVSELWDKVLNVDGVDEALEMVSILQKQRTRVSKCSVGLKKYVIHLRSGARRRIEKWRSQLKLMESAFKAHAQAAEYQDVSIRRVAGFAAKQVMGDAHSLFSDLVMRGDVGLLDLIWLQKERQTVNINEALELQKSELERVERHFQGVVPK